MDWAAVVTGFQAVGGTLVIIAGAVLTWKKAHREDKNEQTDALGRHMRDQDDRIALLERRLDAAGRRERIRDDYIQSLRQHISQEKPPPPPPWPEALTRIEATL